MAGKSNYLESAVVNHLFRTATLAKPTNVYISYHTGDPGETGANEVATGGYARVAVPVADSQWTAPADSGGYQTITNVNAITFPNPTGNQGTAGWFGIWDALTGGNFLYGDAIGTPRTINNGDVAPSFAPGALSIGES